MRSSNTYRPLRMLTVCALLAALTCLLSPIALPIGPIPMSLGLLGMLLTALLLPPPAAAATAAVFLALGICGLPVFSAGSGGAMVLAGPTGGYLWAYLLAAPLISFVAGKPKSSRRCFAACLCGVALCYLCGTLQFCLVTSTPPLAALPLTVLPFLPFDILKACLAVYLASKLKKIVQF